MLDPDVPARRMITFSAASTLTSVSAGVLIYGMAHGALNPNTLTNALFVATACAWVLCSIESRFDSSCRHRERFEQYFLEQLERVEKEIRTDMVVASRNNGRIVRSVD